MQARISIVAVVAMSMMVMSVLVATAGAQAAPVYRWIDAQGQTHYADGVPNGYKGKTAAIDVTSSDVPEGQTKAAQERLNRLKQRLEAARSTRQQDERARNSRPAHAAVGHRASADTGAQSVDYPQLWKVYDQSVECFAPFQNINGTLKPGAHEMCVEMLEPTRQCGVRVWRP